jgi:hypothetical protein
MILLRASRLRRDKGKRMLIMDCGSDHFSYGLADTVRRDQNRNSSCDWKAHLELFCGRRRSSADWMKCRILVIISWQPYQSRLDIRWRVEIFFELFLVRIRWQIRARSFDSLRVKPSTNTLCQP